MEGKSIIIEMDANSKLGKAVIKSDPHNQTPNGKLLYNIIQRHNLVVLNSLEDRCIGSITRKRVTKNSIEESIIDFVLISHDLFEKVESVTIDEDKNHALVNVTKKKQVVSDHNTIVGRVIL